MSEATVTVPVSMRRSDLMVLRELTGGLDDTPRMIAAAVAALATHPDPRPQEPAPDELAAALAAVQRHAYASPDAAARRDAHLAIEAAHAVLDAIEHGRRQA